MLLSFVVAALVLSSAASAYVLLSPARRWFPSNTPRVVTVDNRGLTSVTSPAYRNSYASVTAETSARANCSIEVDYASGPSHAAGLGSKTSSSTGSVSWTWKIGGNTTKGSWPIYVTCSRSGQEATASTAFRVV